MHVFWLDSWIHFDFNADSINYCRCFYLFIYLFFFFFVVSMPACMFSGSTAGFTLISMQIQLTTVGVFIYLFIYLFFFCGQYACMHVFWLDSWIHFDFNADSINYCRCFHLFIYLFFFFVVSMPACMFSSSTARFTLISMQIKAPCAELIEHPLIIVERDRKI